MNKLTEENIYKTYFNSPLGTIELSSTEKGISSLYFVNVAGKKHPVNNILLEGVKQLKEYFGKKRKDFSLPLDYMGTGFQKKVWSELLKIPLGKTVSYLQIAKRIGNGNSTRAVGNANGKNPISIIVPCHRVIGTNGNLVGYGGGIEKKKWLLEFEGALIQKELFI